jgi:hypothetical protein
VDISSESRAVEMRPLDQGVAKMRWRVAVGVEA